MKHKKILKKSMAVILATAIAVTSINTAPAKAQETENSTHYKGNGYEIDYKITADWKEAYNAEITITNTTDETIDNWALGFTMSDEITQIWNGVIKKAENGTYIIKNDRTNQDIQAGKSITIGITAKDKDGIQEPPKNYEKLSEKVPVEKTRTEENYLVTETWEQGYQAQISITNKTDTEIEDWEITFDYKDTIENLWDAEEKSHTGKTYTIKNNTYNQNIGPGETVTFGYTVNHAYNGAEPENIQITEIRTKEVTGTEETRVTLKDGKIDKDYLYKAILPRLILKGKNTEDIRLSDDYDNDGLTLGEEYKYDTDPFKKDTDEDGLSDNEEIQTYKTNPLKADSDNDGMSDGTEVSCGLDPNKKDTDGDGKKDAEETTIQNVRLNGYEEIKDNQVVPQVTLKGSGDYSQKLNAVNDRESYLKNKGYVVGEVYDFQHDEEIEFKEGTLEFYIKDGQLKENNLVDLKIAYYNEKTGELEILDTTYDINKKTVKAPVMHFSTYMVINYKSYLYNSNLLTKRSSGEEDKNRQSEDNVDTYKGHTYCLINAGGSWQEAYDYCTGVGGHLVTIGESGEQEFLNSLMEKYGTKNTYHIGLSGDDNMYSWVNGEPLSYENWASGEPNNKNETVVHMYGKSHSPFAKGEWNDTNNYTSGDGFYASKNAGFICEWESEEAYERYRTKTEDDSYITLSDGSYIRLDKNPELNDESVDTDGDGLPDIYELKEKVQRTFHNPYTGKEETVEMWTFYSNPAEKDTDGDGIEDPEDINCLHFDETIAEETDSYVKFNTGNVWEKTDFSADEYAAEVYSTRISLQLISYSKVINRNRNYDFSMDELVYLSIVNPEGVKIYMDSSTGEKREKLFQELTGRNSRYFRHRGAPKAITWKEVDSKEDGGFFKGEVLSEAEMNFSLKLYRVCDIYTLAETALDMAMLIITLIFVIEATEIVLVNVVSLKAYIELYGIRGGIDTYMAIGTYNVENGLIGALQVEREAESGTSKYLEQLDNLSENKINHMINGSKNSNHGWENLVPDKNWNDIKNIIADVMENGVEGPYKSVFSKKAIINGLEVEVTYTKLSDGTIRISDAWVNQ